LPDAESERPVKARTDELEAERAYVARLYARLDEVRAKLDVELGRVRSSPGGTHQWRQERDALATNLENRLAALDIGDLPLCFGRLDMGDGSRYHVGRLGLAEADYEPLLVDWRAPAAQPFYRATNAVKTDMTGTGMGLYVVKQIADRHGGSLDVESVEGEGSTFTLCIPARAGDQ